MDYATFFKTLALSTIMAAALAMFSLLSACGRYTAVPTPMAAIIEDTPGGDLLIDREFSPCDASNTTDDNLFEYRQYRPVDSGYAAQQQLALEQTMPHQYSSLDKMFPLRGSWRQSKAEIMDLVDRKLWSPELQQAVDLLADFDMALLINVAPRFNTSSVNASAQRMQIMVRNGSTSNDLNQWTRAQVWPISSGHFCGKKIETPTGVYKLDKERIYSEYSSNLFIDAQGNKPDMFETMFLYSQYQNGDMSGVAIHGTYRTELLGRRDSGGCIRLYRDNSKCLFDTITGKRQSPCISNSLLDYRGNVPSLVARNGEADPEFYSASQKLGVGGYRVLVIIYNDENDQL